MSEADAEEPALSELDRAVINAFQGGFPVVERPFEPAAAALSERGIDVSADELLGRIRELDEAGTLSRFGALVNAEEIGGTATLVAMHAPEDRFDEVAETVNSHREVAHNYEREHPHLNMWFVVSVADEDQDSWALRTLVAVCEPCYDLLSTDCTDRIGGFGDAYRRAPQFPAWTGDPRVAVERLPLTGREVWFSDQLRERVTVEEPTGESVNADAAADACLARSTPAAVAVALNEALVADERGPLSTATRRLSDQWESLSERERTAYERRAVDASVPERPGRVVAGDTGFEDVATRPVGERVDEHARVCLASHGLPLPRGRRRRGRDTTGLRTARRWCRPRRCPCSPPRGRSAARAR